VAAVNVRELSVALAVSKDTVCRALARLREAGLAEHRVGERRGGRFSEGGYCVDLDAAGLRIAPATRSAPRRETRPAGGQGGLF
jgi:DNA-binding transcriptional MocR family regulator